MPQPPIEYTDITLTLGQWGRAPLSVDDQRVVLKTLANWSEKNAIPVRAEIYATPDQQVPLVREYAAADSGLELIVRSDPRSDRLAQIANLGVRQVILDVPVSVQAAKVRFLPHGIARSPEWAARAARTAVLAGLSPEIALVDIARARKRDVLAVIDAVMDELRPRNIQPRWRLVDSTGWGDPLPRSRMPRSLPAWIRLLDRERQIPPQAITVQAADTLGLAVANVVAGGRDGAGVAGSLFGLGLGAGWAASEVVFAHLLGREAKLKRLLGLRTRITADLRDSSRPVSGPTAFQFPGGAAPESPREELLDATFPVHPKTLTGRDPLPVLTELSGHAGLLNLMHRNYPEMHFETTDDRARDISQQFEDEFVRGRQVPVSWHELEPKVKKTGLLADD